MSKLNASKAEVLQYTQKEQENDSKQHQPLEKAGFHFQLTSNYSVGRFLKLLLSLIA